MAVREVRKPDLDLRVARDLKYPKVMVAKITRAFLDHIANALVEDGRVYLDRFGGMMLRKQSGGNLALFNDDGEPYVPLKMRVDFRKAPAFKKMLRRRLGDRDMTQGNNDDGMHKYGVNEKTAQDQERLEKQAAEGCPQCGAKLTKHGSVLLCPNHGSEPFEPGG